MNDPQSRLFAEALATLTPEEAYAMSLCVGWIVAMSSGEMLDEAQRMKYGRIAMRGLTRAFGIRHHDALRSLADHYALAPAPPPAGQSR